MPTTSQLQELDKLNRIIKQKSLDYKVSKEYGQETLKEFYKPILDVKTKEQEVIKEQHKEELNELQNLQEGINKMQNLKDSITEELKKQTLVVPLIKSLRDHPGIIAVLKGESDGRDLTGKELHILKQLKDIDDRTLLTLIDYFNKETKNDNDDVFSLASPARTKVPGTPPRESLPSTSATPVDPPEYTRIPQNLKSDKLGEWLIINDLPSKESAELLLKEGRDGRTADEIKDGLKKYAKFLTMNGTPPNFSKGKWPTLKAADPNLYKEIWHDTGKKGDPKFRSSKSVSSVPAPVSSVGSGLSAVSDLIKKLEILYAEKLAGNNNVLTEATEILDTLRRNNVIDINMLKDISKRFVKINE